MLAADQTLTQTSQLLTTIRDVGIVVVLLFILILLIAVIFVVVYAFLRRSTAADAQLTRSNTTNDHLAIALEGATNAFKGLDTKFEVERNASRQYMEENTRAITAVRDVITSLQQSTISADTALKTQVSGVSAQLTKLLEQGEETLSILRKSPEEHAAIESKLDEFLKAVRRDPTLSTGENRATAAPAAQPHLELSLS